MARITQLRRSSNWERCGEKRLMSRSFGSSLRNAFGACPLRGCGRCNRTLFDLTMYSASQITIADAPALRKGVRSQYGRLLQVAEFSDLISRAVDHTKRNRRRFEIWAEYVGTALS